MDILSDVNVNGSIRSNGVSVNGKIISSNMLVHDLICANRLKTNYVNVSDAIFSDRVQTADIISTRALESSEFTTSEFRIAGKMEVPTYGDPTKNYYLCYVSYCLLVPQGCNRFNLAYRGDIGVFSKAGSMFTNILDADSGKYVYMDIQQVYSYGDRYDVVASRTDLDEKLYLIKYLQLTDN